MEQPAVTDVISDACAADDVGTAIRGWVEGAGGVGSACALIPDQWQLTGGGGQCHAHRADSTTNRRTDTAATLGASLAAGSSPLAPGGSAGWRAHGGGRCERSEGESPWAQLTNWRQGEVYDRKDSLWYKDVIQHGVEEEESAEGAVGDRGEEELALP